MDPSVNQGKIYVDIRGGSGFAAKGASINESAVVENGDFRFFRSLYLPNCHIQSHITAQCSSVQSAVLRSHVVRLSVRLPVCPSVTLVICNHIG